MSAAVQADQATKDAPLKDDKLLHHHCGRCWRKAREHAQPPRAFCGKQKYGWSPAVYNPPEREQCVVCVDMVRNHVPCAVCGLKPTSRKR